MPDAVPNATLVADFPNEEKRSFPILWDGRTLEGDGVSRLLRFKEFVHMGGHPDMDVFLDADPEVKSRVVFNRDDYTLDANRDLDALLLKKSMRVGGPEVQLSVAAAPAKSLGM